MTRLGIANRQCIGRTRNLRRCQRTGDWRFFCHDHRFQPVVWASFLIFTVLGGTASILSVVGSRDAERKDSPRLELRLRLGYEGYEISIRNSGGEVARNPLLEIISWSNGAPAADIRESINLPSLVPSYEHIIMRDLLSRYRGKVPVNNELVRCSSSGYMTLSCENCAVPRAWAFFIPDEPTFGEFYDRFVITDGTWPVVEFAFPQNRPKVGEYVHYPEWFQPMIGWYPTKPTGE